MLSKINSEGRRPVNRSMFYLPKPLSYSTSSEAEPEITNCGRPGIFVILLEAYLADWQTVSRCCFKPRIQHHLWMAFEGHYCRRSQKQMSFAQETRFGDVQSEQRKTRKPIGNPRKTTIETQETVSCDSYFFEKSKNLFKSTKEQR